MKTLWKRTKSIIKIVVLEIEISLKTIFERSKVLK